MLRDKYKAEVDAGGAPHEAGLDDVMMKKGMTLLRSVWQAYPELKRGGRPYSPVPGASVTVPLAIVSTAGATASKAAAKRKRGRDDRAEQRDPADDPEPAGSAALGAPGTPSFEHARFNSRLKTIKVQAEQAVRQDQLDSLQTKLKEACKDFKDATAGTPGYKHALSDLVDAANEAIAAQREALQAPPEEPDEQALEARDAAFDSANSRLSEIEKEIQAAERQDQLNTLWKAVGDCFERAEKIQHLSKKQRAQLQNRAFEARARCTNRLKIIKAGRAVSGGASSSSAHEAPSGASAPVVPGFRQWSSAPDPDDRGRNQARDTNRASYSQVQAARGRPNARGSVPAEKAAVSRKDNASLARSSVEMPSAGVSSYRKADSRSNSRSSSSNVSSGANSQNAGDDRPVGTVGDVYGANTTRNRSSSPMNQTTLPYRTGGKDKTDRKPRSKLGREDE